MKWPFVQIADICGRTRMRDPRKYPNMSFRYVDISAIDRNLKAILLAPEILGKDAPSRARKEILEGDILVSTVRPNLNAVAIVPSELNRQVASTGFCVLRPNKSIISGKYLFYLSRTPTFIDLISSKVRGAHYPAVSDLDIKKIEIPLPLLSEQQRIVKILEQADSLCKKRTEADEKASQILPSLFYKMFGDPTTNPMVWKQKPFTKVFDDCTSDFPKLQKQAYQREGRYPVVDQGKELVAGYSDNKSYVRIFKEPVTVFGDHTRAVKLVDFPFIAGGDGSRVFKAKNGFSPVFLSMQLKLHSIPNQGYSRHMREVKRLKFMDPPISLQKAYADLYFHSRSILDAQSSSCSYIDSIWRILLYRAFTGDLTKNWCKLHMKELLGEMEIQKKALAEIEAEKLKHSRGRRIRE